jgi:hypothetical protein
MRLLGTCVLLFQLSAATAQVLDFDCDHTTTLRPNPGSQGARSANNSEGGDTVSDCGSGSGTYQVVTRTHVLASGESAWIANAHIPGTLTAGIRFTISGVASQTVLLQTPVLRMGRWRMLTIYAVPSEALELYGSISDGTNFLLGTIDSMHSSTPAQFQLVIKDLSSEPLSLVCSKDSASGRCTHKVSSVPTSGYFSAVSTQAQFYHLPLFFDAAAAPQMKFDPATVTVRYSWLAFTDR